jgi:hypothetical protein
MKTSTIHINTVRSTVGRIATALVLATAIGAASTDVALADNNDRHDARSDRGRYDQQQGQRQRDQQQAQRQRDQRGRRDERGWNENRDRRTYYPDRYAAPVYAPPPVVYAPRPSPGISLFLPIDIR